MKLSAAVEIDTRITFKKARNAKSKHGIDLGNPQAKDQPFLTMFTDPCVLSNVIWAFYRDELQEQGVATQDDLDELLDDVDQDDVRAELNKSVGGFFPLVRTSYTTLKESTTDPDS